MLNSPWILVLAALTIGAAFGLGARPLLADLLFGRSFRRSPPFRVGDYVLVQPPDRDAPVSGVVTDIGPCASTLLTPQGRTLRLPHRVAAAATVEARRLVVPGTEHMVDIALDAAVDRHRQAAALDAAAMQAWADGFTAGPQPARRLIDRLEGGNVVHRLVYTVDPARHPEAAVRDALLARVQHHLHHAGLAAHGMAGARPAVDPTDPASRAECLARTALFETCLTADERRALADELLVRHEDAGFLVVSEGSPGATMFVVVAGTLEVSVGASRLATARRLATVGPGEFFGEMAPLTGAPRSATVATLTPVLLLEIPPATLATLLRTKPELADALSRVMSEHLRRDADREGAA